jgi:hypothetical protein
MICACFSGNYFKRIGESAEERPARFSHSVVFRTAANIWRTAITSALVVSVSAKNAARLNALARYG